MVYTVEMLFKWLLLLLLKLLIVGFYIAFAALCGYVAHRLWGWDRWLVFWSALLLFMYNVKNDPPRSIDNRIINFPLASMAADALRGTYRRWLGKWRAKQITKPHQGRNIF